jgi:hypothetical protein
MDESANNQVRRVWLSCQRCGAPVKPKFDVTEDGHIVGWAYYDSLGHSACEPPALPYRPVAWGSTDETLEAFRHLVHFQDWANMAQTLVERYLFPASDDD